MMAIGGVFGRFDTSRLLAQISCALVLFMHGCGVAGRHEHEAGVFLSKELKSYVCQTEVKDFTLPCGSFDVRYEAAPQALSINIYGIGANGEISEVVDKLRASKESKAVHFKVMVNFYRNIGGHELVRSETIGG